MTGPWLVLCTGKTKTGRHCRAWAMRGSDRCFTHGGRERVVPPEQHRAVQMAATEAVVRRVLGDDANPLDIGWRHGGCG